MRGAPYLCPKFAAQVELLVVDFTFVSLSLEDPPPRVAITEKSRESSPAEKPATVYWNNILYLFPSVKRVVLSDMAPVTFNLQLRPDNSIPVTRVAPPQVTVFVSK